MNKLNTAAAIVFAAGLAAAVNAEPLEPIAAPEWVEESSSSAAFLWHCWACGYKFESVAVFRAEEAISARLAA